MRRVRGVLIGTGVALFALAVGVALGAGALNGPATSLTDRSSEVSAGQKVDSALASFNADFASGTADDVVGKALNGQSIVVMTTPDADRGDVSGVVDQLTASGADITGQVGFTEKLLDAANRQFVEGVAQQAASEVPGVKDAESSYAGIGTAIGRAFLGKKSERIDATGSTIVSAFEQGNLISTSKKLNQRATLAILIVGPDSDDGANTVISSLVGALDTSGRGVVVAGPSTSSESGGAVAAVRESAAGKSVSSVDVTNSVAGRIVTALALAQEVRGNSGEWGTGRSADGAVPQ